MRKIFRSNFQGKTRKKKSRHFFERKREEKNILRSIFQEEKRKKILPERFPPENKKRKNFPGPFFERINIVGNFFRKARKNIQIKHGYNKRIFFRHLKGGDLLHQNKKITSLNRTIGYISVKVSLTNFSNETFSI